ncbi:MAG: sulfatase-like hydrolase/transferase [Verrucomicrobia bacterium]|nr:sulfatase-like hydrolase/transferase [Verrucomicrobiota bacterium]
MRLLRHLAALAPAVLIFTVAPTRAASAEPRPNVVLILADDLGYETLAANGGTSYRTPALDRLAAGGVRFTQCYAQPLCTPTRVQLMTGQSNVRNYINFGTMDPALTTFGHHFQRAGYRTGIAGKWQLGQDKKLPQTLGFHESYLWQHTRRPPRYANAGLEHNGEPLDFSHGEYGPDLVHGFVHDFITRHRDEPFLLYYPMMLTHAPYQPTPDSKDWDPKAIGEQVNQAEAHFGDMVEYMDRLVGKLVAHLESLKLRERTLIVFLGDNGTGRGTRSMFQGREFIGGKGTTTDAGMHVPLVVNWPGRVTAGRVCGDLVDTTDFLPTICEAAGLSVAATPVIDGRSFWPQLRGEKGRPHDWLYAWYSPRQNNDLSAREFAFTARHKLYRSGEFFDLAADPGEKTPLALASLTGESAAAAKTLRTALGQFADVRPAHLDALAAQNTEGKAAKKKARKDK